MFPPRNWKDVEAYDHAEIVAGYTECRPDDPPPGENRSEGYRWGWSNGMRDSAGSKDDGFDHIRHEGARKTIRPTNNQADKLGMIRAGMV